MAIGDKLFVADKPTLDQVKALIGTANPATGDLTTLFRGLKLLANYVDELETRLTATRAGKLDLVGNTGDSAGTGSIFARLAQIAGYTDTLETNLGTTGQSASSSGTALQRLAYIISGLPGVASVAYASNTIRMSANTERSTTSGVSVLVKRFVVTVAGSVRVQMELKNSIGGGGVKTYAFVYLDGEQIDSFLGDTVNWETESCNVPNVKVGSVIDIYLSGGKSGGGEQSTAYIRNVSIRYDLLAPGSVMD